MNSQAKYSKKIVNLQIAIEKTIVLR